MLGPQFSLVPNVGSQEEISRFPWLCEKKHRESTDKTFSTEKQCKSRAVVSSRIQLIHRKRKSSNTSLAGSSASLIRRLEAVCSGTPSSLLTAHDPPKPSRLQSPIDLSSTPNPSHSTSSSIRKSRNTSFLPGTSLTTPLPPGRPIPTLVTRTASTRVSTTSRTTSPTQARQFKYSDASRGSARARTHPSARAPAPSPYTSPPNVRSCRSRTRGNPPASSAAASAVSAPWFQYVHSAEVRGGGAGERATGEGERAEGGCGGGVLRGEVGFGRVVAEGRRVEVREDEVDDLGAEVAEAGHGEGGELVEAEMVSLLVQFPEMANNDRRVAYNMPRILECRCHWM
ncbi:hypothetical protein GTA08_BOTSDO01759 [Botryosphaeria dothidea]|uniref:Uncharacterized protein n=1 Tax=Botryosphaeria dothidea TaxID=55169 RepID=A0A8H4J757_9PEZI|nr:hypothetical protein GTA08_BOTSDO01759 [Botryosphaeria dothidea]